MRLACFVVVVLAFTAGCPEAVPTPEPTPEQTPPPGTFGGRCATGGFCNDDLVCSINDVCIRPPNEGEGEGEGDVGEGEGEGEGEGDGPCDVDADQDGSCSDVDCDDRDRQRFPGNIERCDLIDENCNNQMNDSLDCTFVAHTADQLFRVDPFAHTVTFDRDIDDPNGVLDIDIDQDGDLVAATSAGVFEVRANGTLASIAGVTGVGGRINGVCITGTGTMFLTTDDGADSAAYKVEGNQTVEVGGFSDGLVSSGDCVVTKEEDVLMSAKDPDDVAAPDRLVIVDADTGATSDVGDIGFAKVFGLSASFGFLFGVTSTGQVLQIEREDASAVLLFVAEDGGDPIRFAGAANGD